MKTLENVTAAIQNLNIIRHVLTDDGQFPNNGRLPLLVYQNVLQATDRKTIQDLFESNSWTNAWEDGIYNFHHYHSTAHEVLAASKGTARIQFGGPSGVALSLNVGDVVVIPAGVAHCFLEGDTDFKVVGAYPDNQSYDLLKGEPQDRPKADQNIQSLSLPENDPIYGADGPLLKNWKTK